MYYVHDNMYETERVDVLVLCSHPPFQNICVYVSITLHGSIFLCVSYNFVEKLNVCR